MYYLIILKFFLFVFVFFEKWDFCLCCMVDMWIDDFMVIFIREEVKDMILIFSLEIVLNNLSV